MAKEQTVCCFGTFDLLHVGHVRLLTRAKTYGTRLVVGLSTDELNVAKKQRVPVIPYSQRREMLLALRCVDDVFAEHDLGAKNAYVRAHNIDLIVHGDDWKGKLKAECKIVYLPRTPDISTTDLITRKSQIDSHEAKTGN